MSSLEIPGDGINGLIESFRQKQDRVRFVQVRHEEAAAFMACGHSTTADLADCSRPRRFRRAFPRHVGTSPVTRSLEKGTSPRDDDRLQRECAEESPDEEQIDP
jgi:hypothetical protein